MSKGRIDLGEAVGYATVVIGGAEKEIDVLEVADRTQDIIVECRESGDRFQTQVKKYLEQLGFPGDLPDFMAERFVTEIFASASALRESLKKKDGGSLKPDSPATTASTSSD